MLGHRVRRHLLHQADDVEEGRQGEPVSEQDEEEDGGHDGEEAPPVLLAGHVGHQVVEGLDDGLDEVLRPPGHQLPAAGEEEHQAHQQQHHQPGGDHGVGDLDQAEVGQHLGAYLDVGAGAAQEDEAEDGQEDGAQEEEPAPPPHGLLPPLGPWARSRSSSMRRPPQKASPRPVKSPSMVRSGRVSSRSSRNTPRPAPRPMQRATYQPMPIRRTVGGRPPKLRTSRPPPRELYHNLGLWPTAPPT